MTLKVPVDEWLPRFVASLKVLLPELRPAAAIGVALHVYDIAGDRPPEDVAADYASSESSP